MNLNIEHVSKLNEECDHCCCTHLCAIARYWALDCRDLRSAGTNTEVASLVWSPRCSGDLTWAALLTWLSGFNSSISMCTAVHCTHTEIKNSFPCFLWDPIKLAWQAHWSNLAHAACVTEWEQQVPHVHSQNFQCVSFVWCEYNLPFLSLFPGLTLLFSAALAGKRDGSSFPRGRFTFRFHCGVLAGSCRFWTRDDFSGNCLKSRFPLMKTWSCPVWENFLLTQYILLARITS